MIFKTYQKNLPKIRTKIEPIKNYTSLANKTRVESLNERIKKANELINSFVEKTIIKHIEDKKDINKKYQINEPFVTTLNEVKKSDDNNNNTINTNKSVQVNEEIINNANENNKNEENNNQEIKDENNNTEINKENNNNNEINNNPENNNNIENDNNANSEKIENIEEEYDSIEEAIVESELNDGVKDYFDQAMTDYTAYSKNKEAYEHPEEEPGVPIIELITQWEYDNEALSNDKRNLTYFEDDDTLCDEDDEIIDNPAQYIGEEALTAFGSPDEDEENIIHVRNNSRSCDYEIERIKDSYQRQVLGIIT